LFSMARLWSLWPQRLAHREPGIDFFPLTCDYRERTAAAGKFPGGFLKREGRPTMKETLTSRLIDRPIRPLFPEGFYDEVQVQAQTLSSDRQTDADMLGDGGASAALSFLRTALPGTDWVVFGWLRLMASSCRFRRRISSKRATSTSIVSGSKDAILMIEGFAREMPEERMLEAIDECQRIIRELCLMQKELMEKGGKAKKEYDIPDYKPLQDRIYGSYLAEMKQAKAIEGKLERNDVSKQLKEKAKAEIIPDPNAEGAVCQMHTSPMSGTTLRKRLFAS
jgi:polyribonucleotide nucleotidyltransferase